MFASENGHHDTVKLLLISAEVNTLDDDFLSPLLHAAINGHTEIMQTLIENGAGTNVSPEASRLAIVRAAEKGHHKSIKLL